MRRSRISGCSLLIMKMRAPAARSSGVSGACSKPSTVQSMMISEALSAATAAGWRCSASDAPVERTGTGALCGGVGILT